MNRESNKQEKKEEGIGLNLNYFLNCDDKLSVNNTNVQSESDMDLDSLAPGKKKRGRPKKEE